jgi:hypothetical protein
MYEQLAELRVRLRVRQKQERIHRGMHLVSMQRAFKSSQDQSEPAGMRTQRYRAVAA